MTSSVTLSYLLTSSCRTFSPSSPVSAVACGVFIIGHEEYRWLLCWLVENIVEVFFRPLVSSKCRRDPGTGRFFRCPGLSVDQACNVTTCDAEHCSQSLVPVAKFALLSPVEFLQPLGGTGEVPSVV